MRGTRVLLITVLGVGLTHVFVEGARLPPVVASHFGVGGAPDAFLARGWFLAVLAGAFALVAATGFGATWLVERLPAEQVNLPNRDYWLTPERRAATAARFAAYNEVFAAAIGGLLIAVNGLVFRANAEHAPLDEVRFLALLGAFFAFVIVWLVQLSRAFRVPSEAR
jgi:hypothetical protein